MLQHPAPSTTGLHQGSSAIITNEQLQSAFEQLAAGRGPGVFAQVTDQGEEVFSAAAGTADLARPRPITSTDRFRIASATKPMLATVILQLTAEGRLAPTDTVQHLLPELLPGGDRISVESLLRMRSGLPDYVWAVLGDPPEVSRLQRYFRPEELIGIALAQPDRWEPGRAWRYSNTDYLLLGLIAEAITGTALPELLRQRIFGPLGLHATCMPVRDVHIEGPHPRGYFRNDIESGYVDTTEFTPSESWASGAVISTPPELARFLDALLDGRLLPPTEVDAMRTMAPATGELHYGMGLFSYRLANGTLLHGHGGTHFGVACYAFRSERGRTAVIYQNSWDREPRHTAPERLPRGRLRLNRSG
ncbi:beta-lactamase family protein [Streptacidiphilus sp. 4-A2]|nr:beta-lactamase family protein [Streptacidiphilus sp. 4-A2]